MAMAGSLRYSVFGVRIHVGQQIPRVFLLEFDQARIEEREPLAPLDLVEVLHAVAGFVGAARRSGSDRHRFRAS